MERLITRKEAAARLGISTKTLDVARSRGQISYIQYVQNGCVYFTEKNIQEYIARRTRQAKPVQVTATYRRRRGVKP